MGTWTCASCAPGIARTSGDGLALTLDDGETDALGLWLRLGDGESDGDGVGDGVALGDGLTDADTTEGRMAYARELEAAFPCAHVNAPVAPAVAFSAELWQIEVSVPVVLSRSARCVSAPGEVQAGLVTAKSGEFATVSTTHAPSVSVVISAIVSLAEALASCRMASIGSPAPAAPRYSVTHPAQEFVRPVTVSASPLSEPSHRFQYR